MKVIMQGRVYLEGQDVSSHVREVVGTHSAGELPTITVEFFLDDIVREGDTFKYYVGGRQGENKRL